MGWGGFADKVMSWFTPEQRVKRIRSEISKLEQQRNKILQEHCTYEKANKIMDLNGRIADLKRLLGNQA